MRNLNKPNRYNVASIQAQQTLGGDVMESAEEGQYVTWRDYKWLLESHAFVQDQWKDLDADYARLKSEVERLDNLVRYWSDKYQNENARFLRACEQIKAKEGKQS